MTMTPLDVQQQRFKNAFRGYDSDEVQNFLALVSERLGQLVRENNDHKIEEQALIEEVERLREQESTLKEVLLTAQSAMDQARERASKEAELIVAEAEIKAEKIVHGAHRRVNEMLGDLSDLKQQRVRILEELKGVIRSYDKLVAYHEEASEEREEDAEAKLALFERAHRRGTKGQTEKSKIKSV